MAADHDSAHDHDVKVKEGTAGYHPHESPWTILIPLGVLSLGAVFAGFLFHAAFVEPEAGAEFWKAASPSTSIWRTRCTTCRWLVKLAPLVVMLIGLADRLPQLYRTSRAPARFVAMFRAAAIAS